MSDLALLLLYGVATWRISHILKSEVGPFRVFDTLRWVTNRLGWGNGSERRVAIDLNCIWCTSVWVGLGLMLLNHHREDVANLVVAVFVLSTVAIVMKGAGETWALFSRYVTYRVHRS